ncbi:YaaC family protein [Agrobacterium vitis]|uniref:YaaC family protein n=1 Tax=Agrobacterium vitis TaxID=373 RepID=UPI0012E96747|nr:YaaC family protein [Agrobacterium vitis]MVA72819.1 hypothetical protein [Agrobacterium vitis]
MERALWEPLLRFESRDYLCRRYKKIHEKTLNATRAHEISSCFTQGREYFSSASNASDTVKPLLIYYGVASLSKGATLLRDISKREESLTPGHGLTTIDWAKTLAGGISQVLNLQVQSTKGLFQDFVHGIGNCQSYEWLGQHNQIGGFRNDFGKINFLDDKSQISLKDLLSRERELIGEFDIADDKGWNVDIGTIVSSKDYLRLHFALTEKTDSEKIIQAHNPKGIHNISTTPHPRYPHIPAMRTLCIEIAVSGENQKKHAPIAIEQSSNVGWIIRPFQNGDKIIDIHRVFIESYILGMLSRYFPSKWISILGGEKGDIARSVIIAAVTRIETKFPKLLTDQL